MEYVHNTSLKGKLFKIQNMCNKFAVALHFYITCKYSILQCTYVCAKYACTHACTYARAHARTLSRARATTAKVTLMMLMLPPPLLETGQLRRQWACDWKQGDMRGEGGHASTYCTLLTPCTLHGKSAIVQTRIQTNTLSLRRHRVIVLSEWCH